MPPRTQTLADRLSSSSLLSNSAESDDEDFEGGSDDGSGSDSGSGSDDDGSASGSSDAELVDEEGIAVADIGAGPSKKRKAEGDRQAAPKVGGCGGGVGQQVGGGGATERCGSR
jgi:hypothetical protein